MGLPKSWKNTLIAELIWLAGAATQTFAPGGKHPRAGTDFYWYEPFDKKVAWQSVNRASQPVVKKNIHIVVNQLIRGVYSNGVDRTIYHIFESWGWRIRHLGYIGYL